jgi:hypothetical protein
MVESKSTDKLALVRDIIRTTFDCVSGDKMEKLLEVDVDWKSVNVGTEYCPDYQAVPQVKITFKG